MTLPCCSIDGEYFQPYRLEGDEAERWISPAGPGLKRIEFLAPQVSRPSCISDIEAGMGAIPGVKQARVNLTARRVAIVYAEGEVEPQLLIDKLGELGYAARPFDPRETGLLKDDSEAKALLRAMAVAGFAAGNVMLLSVSVWSGADAATRDLFHWISAMIALPAVAYAGRPFFRSAINALRLGRTNMDVPISLGVLLASAMSLFETINGRDHAYFDASVMLLFFLLTGRYLDQLMRVKARSAIAQLVSLSAEGATVIGADGLRRFVPARDLKPGMSVAVAAGSRLPADGIVLDGSSDMDRSLLTGESAPEPVTAGSKVHAGELNLTGPLTVSVTAAGNDTFLSELVRLMSAAEQSQSRYIRIADRLARFYSPAVHLLAAITLAGWILLGHGWHDSLMTAVAVLIITCPCALGLAVPAVQVVTSGRLFRSGIMIKDGAALEKLAAIDTVIFDKTGTLTRGEPQLVAPLMVSTETLAIAAGLAQASRHPLSRALVREVERRGLAPADISEATEQPGLGLSGKHRGEALRLGSRAWCGMEDATEDKGPSRIRLPARRQATGRFPVRGPHAQRRGRDHRPAEGTRTRCASPVGRPRSGGTPGGGGPRNRVRRLAGLAPGQARLRRNARQGRTQGADGGRRHQRCRSTRRRLHLHGAIDGLRHRPHRRRDGLHGRVHPCRGNRDRGERQGAACRQGELHTGRGLQRAGRAAGHGGSCLAAGGCHCHVDLLDHRHRQCAAAGTWRDSPRGSG